MTHLTAIIMTKNEAEHIVDCIETLRFADAILVFDSYSQDDTVALAREAGADVVQRVFDNFAAQRNAALNAVTGKTDWVLFVDADERVTPELAAEVRDVTVKEGYAAWRIPRYNYIFGKVTKGAGWYPDYQTRLICVGAAHYDPDVPVHEVAVMLDGIEGTMSEHFIHYNYRDLAHFLEKQRRYVLHDAQSLQQEGVRPKPQNYILQPVRQFYWRFITLKGYTDGWHGLRLSLLMGWYEFRKYVELGKLWRVAS